MDALRKVFKELELDYLNAQKKIVEKTIKSNTEYQRVLDGLLDKINGEIQVAAASTLDDS